MTSSSATFPAFIRAEYDGNSNGFRAFEAAFQQSAEQAQKRFVDSFSEVGDKVSKALSRGLNMRGALDLDTSSLRQATTDAAYTEQALATMLRTAQALALETHDTSDATRAYIQALSAQRIEAASNRREAESQLATYTRLQAALDGTAASNSRLTQSYRATYQEAARLAALEVSNQRFGASIAPAMSVSATQNGATTSALAELARSQDDARRKSEQLEAQIAQTAREMDNLRRAEAGAVEGGRILQAVYQGTAEELGRVKKSAAEAAQIFEQLADAQAEVANRKFTSFVIPSLDSRALNNGAGYQALAEAERAAEQYGRQLAELRQQVDPLAFEQARVNKEIEFAALAFKKGDISADQYADRVQQLNTSLTQMNGGMRHTRQGMVMVGQQMQDVAISFIGGQRASTILSQQLPQLAYAMSNFGGKVGAVATTLSGPWSLALVAGSFAAGLFIDKLMGMDDGAKKSKESLMSMTDALSASKFGTEEATKAIDEYVKAQQKSRDGVDRNITQLKAEAEARLKETLATREQIKAVYELELARASTSLRGAGGNGADEINVAVGKYQQLMKANDDALDEVRKALPELLISDAKLAAQSAVDPIKRINRQYDDMAHAAEKAAAGNIKLARSLKATLTGIEQRRAADLKAERERQQADRNQRKPSLSQHTAQETARFITPVQGGRITSTPGIRIDPITGKRAGHAGIDIAAPAGTPVSAPAGGTVIEAGTLAGYGKVVFIDHGAGTITRLAHLSKINVTKGEAVTTGQNVGAVGSTGRSTGNHLHWETRVGGKVIDPRGKPLPVDPLGTAQDSADMMERAKREAEKLQRQIDSTVTSVERLNAQFDEAPRDVDRASLAVAELNKQIAAIDAKLKDGALSDEQRDVLDETRKRAVHTRDTLIPERLKRPFDDEIAAMQQQKDLQDLLLQGRRAEYDVLNDKLDLARQLGVQTVDQLKVELERRGISEAQYQAYLKQREALRAQSLELEYQQEQQQRLLQVVEDVAAATRNIFYDLFDGKGLNAAKNFFNGLYNITKKNLADEVYTAVFGDTFQKQKLKILGLDQVDQTGRDMATAIAQTIDPIKMLGEAAADAAAHLSSTSNAANDNDPESNLAGLVAKVGLGTDKLGNKIQQVGDALKIFTKNVPDAGEYGDIIVTAITGKTNNRGSDLKVIGDSLSKSLGRNSPISKELGKFSDIAGKALKGAAIGEATSGVLKSLGIKQSKTGAQIGGAIGSFIPIPGGQVIGSILGGTIGGMFKKAKWGTSVAGENVSTAGNNGGARDASSGAAGGIHGSLQQIADRLGGEVGNYRVSIGQYKGNWRVSTTGYGGKLNFKGNTGPGGKGLNDFGDDQQAAIAFAIRDAVMDGAITGISAAAKRLISMDKDIDGQIQKALDFEGVFTRLKAHKDPMAHALDGVDRGFNRLKKIFAEAGASAAEYAQLEELYGIERANAVKEASERITASLKSLYKDLTIGDNGRSLRDRLSAAQAEYDPLKQRVMAGDTSAYDDFAEAARAMLDIQRQFSGSQTGYFDLLDEITQITKARIDADTSLANIAVNRDTPFTPSGTVAANDNSAILGSMDQTNAILAAILRTIQDGGGIGALNGASFNTAAFQ